MLKGLSSVLEKSKNIKLPVLNGKKADKADKASNPKAAATSPAVTEVVAPPAVNTQVPVDANPDTKETELSTRYRSAFAGNAIAEYVGRSTSVENADLVITAAYKQVFGNAYLMDNERSPKAESQFRNGDISVLEFVRTLAKSDHYRKLFWEKHTNVTAIELNFKHLLGRAPKNYAEISEHIQIIAAGGFEAEIDSYLDSDEYLQTFGTMYVPYKKGYSTQPGVNGLGFTRSFSLYGTACGSDKTIFGGDNPSLKPNLLADDPGEIPEIRAIPNSYPAELDNVPTPRVPKELYSIARELLGEMRERKGLVRLNY